MTTTAQRPDPALESLLAFWRDAGVDALYEVEPVNRTRTQPAPEVRLLARPAPHASATPASARAPTDASAPIAEARRIAAAARDLEELAAAIAGFESCPLRHEGARQSVFSRGRRDADIVVIGEAPGAEEDAQGAPFVGRAGQLLDRMLSAAGLSDRVFITNTVYWRPPGNRTPSSEEQAICAPFVERTITLIRPRLLLLVGAASAKSLLKRQEGILTLRGHWHEWSAEEGEIVVPALPTLHPAFLLRQPLAKKKAWADLLSLRERLDRETPQALQTET